MHKLSIRRPARALHSPATWKSTCWKRRSLCALALVVCAAPLVHADATLTYELRGPDSSKTVKIFSTARFFARIDDPGDAEHYLLFQAGKFFPVYAVDSADQTYVRLTAAVTPYLGPASPSSTQMTELVTEPSDDQDSSHQAAEAPADAEDSTSSKPATASAAPQGAATKSGTSTAPSARSGGSPAAILKPTKKTHRVAGISCRIVHELRDGEPIMEHCMANSSRLDVSDREVITLARLFAMSRHMEFGWLGIGTEDEQFVSIQSKDLRDNRMLQLTSLSTAPLPSGYLRIPRTFKRIQAEPQIETEPATKTLD